MGACRLRLAQLAMEPADDRHPLGARVPHLVRHRVRPEDDERARPRGDVDVLRGREQRRVARREVGEEGAAAAHAAVSLEDAQVASVALPPPLVRQGTRPSAGARPRLRRDRAEVEPG